MMMISNIWLHLSGIIHEATAATLYKGYRHLKGVNTNVNPRKELK